MIETSDRNRASNKTGTPGPERRQKEKKEDHEEEEYDEGTEEKEIQDRDLEPPGPRLRRLGSRLRPYKTSPKTVLRQRTLPLKFINCVCVCVCVLNG